MKIEVPSVRLRTHVVGNRGIGDNPVTYKNADSIRFLRVFLLGDKLNFICLCYRGKPLSGGAPHRIESGLRVVLLI